MPSDRVELAGALIQLLSCRLMLSDAASREAAIALSVALALVLPSRFVFANFQAPWPAPSKRRQCRKQPPNIQFASFPGRYAIPGAPPPIPSKIEAAALGMTENCAGSLLPGAMVSDERCIEHSRREATQAQYNSSVTVSQLR